jgi:hypothetical protein
MAMKEKINSLVNVPSLHWQASSGFRFLSLVIYLRMKRKIFFKHSKTVTMENCFFSSHLSRWDLLGNGKTWMTLETYFVGAKDQKRSERKVGYKVAGSFCDTLLISKVSLLWCLECISSNLNSKWLVTIGRLFFS